MKHAEFIERARELRKNATPAEQELWEHIRRKKLGGHKFLRQYPIVYQVDTKPRYFIADFYCAEAKLVIELDGKIHEHQKEEDKWREDIIRDRGLKVLRFKNEDLKEIWKVIKVIKEHLSEPGSNPLPVL